jgi:type I restriction enzyme R subunit
MKPPSIKEDHISQIPALQFLQKLGYTYLLQGETFKFLSPTLVVLHQQAYRKGTEKLTENK